ncbi:leucine-rich repeat domain-containing protein [Paenibacillus hexagrammi]|uniref:Leucine-rich repeat domain-containing protein n=1 Tax=Paenibacillus hexagrammi TaxID=2908839 RepID=A0ABY3SPE0_9BACL|nr:leucine-rich repeat domain-containing protein [Paenibacillus sp. YPD9-1]UJF35902.1 leucine-rich repeat domain-containing protein [Paenibacillus sp. YPD9-1]
MRLHTDPRGEAYQQIIDIAIRKSEYFVLSEKLANAAEPKRRSHLEALEALEPYLEKTVVIHGESIDEIMHVKKAYRSRAFYTAGTHYLYRCSAESGRILQQLANRLSDWAFPHLPEDLCFLKQGGGDFLYSVVHEHMYGMEITEEEATELSSAISGLFLDLKVHQDFDRLLDDAIRHRTDWLYISRHGLTELPERIRELTELRELEIFEQDLYRLPEVLFELSKLECLKILTADLESIPASISRLSNLRELSVHCGSSDRPTPGWRVKPKEEISLNYIPPEIGELQNLQLLTIQYNSIHELPLELLKLKNLRILNISMCMIKQKPGFLKQMKQLGYVNVSQGEYETE